MPVKILKAVMQEPLDFALLYLPTKESFGVDEMESVSRTRVGDKVTDVNFALGVAKQYSHGTIGSQRIHDTAPELNGDFLVQMDGGPGSSGSGVLHDGKLIGIVIYGFNEGTIGMGVEPIDSILAAIPNTPKFVAPPVNDQPDFFERGAAGIYPYSTGQRRGERSEPRQPRQPRAQQPREHRGRSQEPRGEHRGQARSHQGPERHGRIDRHRVRVVHDHLCIQWQGEWLLQESYPPWLFSDDVYFVEIAPGVWEIIDFENPTLVLQVVIED